MQNSLKEHYQKADAIVAERQAEMNFNLARIANDKALRDANDLIQKQRTDILDLHTALTRIDTLENALGTLMDTLENTGGDRLIDLTVAREVLMAGKVMPVDG
jgi:hypothetical protein